MKMLFIASLLLSGVFYGQKSLAVSHPGRRTWANIHAKELCFVAKEGRKFNTADAVSDGHEHYFAVVVTKKEDLKSEIVAVSDYDGHSLCKIEVADGKVVSVEKASAKPTATPAPDSMSAAPKN